MIKAEFIYSRRFKTLEQLQLDLLYYVHWFKSICLHGIPGYLSSRDELRIQTKGFHPEILRIGETRRHKPRSYSHIQTNLPRRKMKELGCSYYAAGIFILIK